MNRVLILRQELTKIYNSRSSCNTVTTLPKVIQENTALQNKKSLVSCSAIEDQRHKATKRISDTSDHQSSMSICGVRFPISILQSSNVALFLRYRVLKLVCTKGDFGRFMSAQYHVDDSIPQTRYIIQVLGCNRLLQNIIQHLLMAKVKRYRNMIMVIGATC